MQTDQEYLEKIIHDKLGIDPKKDNLKVSTCKFDVNKVSIKISRRSIFSRNGKELDAVDAMFNLITILNHY